MTRRAHRRSIERQEPWFDGGKPLDPNRKNGPQAVPPQVAQPQPAQPPARPRQNVAAQRTETPLPQMSQMQAAPPHRPSKPEIQQPQMRLPETREAETRPPETQEPDARPAEDRAAPPRRPQAESPFAQAGRSDGARRTTLSFPPPPQRDSPWRKIEVSPKARARAERAGLFRYVAKSARDARAAEDAATAFAKGAGVKRPGAKAASARAATEKEMRNDKPRPRKLKTSPPPRQARRPSPAGRWATTAAIVGLSAAAVIGLSLAYPFGGGHGGASPFAAIAGGPAPSPQDGFAAIEAAPGSAPPSTARPAAQTASRTSDDAFIEVAP